MYIQNGADDKDIIFRSDDGSGGQTEYFRLDGSQTLDTTFLLLEIQFMYDNAKDKFLVTV